MSEPRIGLDTAEEPIVHPVPQELSLLPVFRALAQCSQQADRAVAAFVEPWGLTASQFDVLATLGDTDGMPCKDLSRLSLITGGTLNPVLERMVAKGLVRREKGKLDSRQTIVGLTAEGQALYERIFGAFVRQMRSYLAALAPDEQAMLVRLLSRLGEALSDRRDASEL